MECCEAGKTGSCNHPNEYSLSLPPICVTVLSSVNHRQDNDLFFLFSSLTKLVYISAHSMEEAEVLCDRLGVFVDGSLQCIGNPKEVP